MSAWRLLALVGIVAMAGATAPGVAAAIPTGGAKASCAGLQATIVGTPRADALQGTRGADVIVAGDGEDRISAGDGDDLICAGAGADTVHGGRGGDRIRGGRGADRLLGGPDDDLLAGGVGADSCEGGAGADTLRSCAHRRGAPGADPQPIPVPTPVATDVPNPAQVDPPLPPEPTSVEFVPPLVPAFDPAIVDYSVACDGTPLTVSAKPAPEAAVAIDGGSLETEDFDAEVPLQENQAFELTVEEAGVARTYHVRCLPSDFPIWEYERLREPRHAFYMAAPTLSTGSQPYAVIFDADGVPVWWHKDEPGPIDAKFLPDGRVAWWGQQSLLDDGYEVRDLEGETLEIVRFVGHSTDIHELQETEGNYLITSYRPRAGVDLTQFGGGVGDDVIDGVVQEVDSLGNVIWEWSTEGHIDLHETGRWWPSLLAGDNARDVVHINAVEPVGGDAVMISLRHTDAVYKIDKATGNVVWKLGGSWTPKSLAVLDDPHAAYPLGGQHDVRLLPDGTITIYDNRTGVPGAPRGVRYQVDEIAKTATLVEQVTDPLVPDSFCCGSSRRSADGSWLFSWGGRSLVTEFDADGNRTFRLGFGGTAFSYRAVPAPDGVLTPEALRAGMDSMHPRP